MNRKRKKLEENGILDYFTRVNHTKEGSGHLPARQLHIITFKEGITRKQGVESFLADPHNEVMLKHMHSQFFGERQGRLVLVYVLESYQTGDLLEIFNAEIIPWLHLKFGDKSVQDIRVIDLTTEIRLFHNYMPGINIKNGRIKEDWPDGSIFVS